MVVDHAKEIEKISNTVLWAPAVSPLAHTVANYRLDVVVAPQGISSGVLTTTLSLEHGHRHLRGWEVLGRAAVVRKREVN